MITPEPDALEPLVRDLHRQATPWLPAGQGSRLHWGAPVAADTPVVSCRRLDRLLEHAVGDFTVTVQAGMPLRDLQAALAEQGQWLALDDGDAWGEFDEQRFLKELGNAQSSTPGAAAP